MAFQAACGSRSTLHQQRTGVVGVQRPPALISRPTRPRVVVARAESRSSSDGFVTGFVTGGLVFGVLGFLFAPQISRALLGDDQRLRLPRFLEEEAGPKDPEATKRELIDKIAQLNASIDEVAAQLQVKPSEATVEAEATPSG